MRRPALIVLLTLAGACSPAGEPLSPQLAGWWRPTTSPDGCETRAFRFDRNTIQLRRNMLTIKTFEIVEALVAGNEAYLTLRVADEAAILASIETKTPGMRSELPKTELKLSLRRSGDRLLPGGNFLIREDGPRGSRAPKPGEARAIAAVFTMASCQA